MGKHTSVIRAIRAGVRRTTDDEGLTGLEEDPERSDMTYPAALRSMRDGQF